MEVPKESSLVTLARELRELVFGYAKQETLDPIKRLGRVLLFGAMGASLVGLGVVFVALAALRALQLETDAFDGNLSWAPYGIVIVGLGGVAVLTMMLKTRAKQHADRSRLRQAKQGGRS